MKTFLLALVAAVSLSACSSIIEGTSQEIAVNTNPPGAVCQFQREGTVIATIPVTPAATTIKKTKHDITISCDKAGYQTATFMNNSDVAGATVGNIILGGGIGWAIDSASGADNKYTSPVNITLVPAVAGAAVPGMAAPRPNTVAPGMQMKPVGT